MTPPSRRPGRPRRRAWLVPLCGVVAASGLASCSSPAHRKAAPPPPTTTTTTVPEPQYQPSPFSWSRDAGAALDVGGGSTATLSALIATQLSGSWQLFGTRTTASGSPTATVWRSTQGTAWSASDLVPGATPTVADAAAQFRNTTAVVGSTSSGAAATAAVWISQSGGPFALAQVTAAPAPSTMDLVTAGALGFFATGTVDGRFALWESTNGQEWSEVPGAEKTITSLPGARVNALLSVGDTVYAAGSVQPGAVPEAAVWSSSDGLDWHRVTSAPTSFSGDFGHMIFSLSTIGGGAPGQTGLVAVGAIDGGSGWEPASWISPNGISWSLPSTDFPALAKVPSGAGDLGPAGGSAALSVTTIPAVDGDGSLVAAGGGPYGQAVWSSTDGLHWSAVPLPAADASSPSWTAGLVAATAGQTIVADPEPGQPYLLTDTSAGAGSGAAGWSQPSSDPATFGAVRPEADPVSIGEGSAGLVLTVDVVDRPQTIGPATVTVTRLSSTDGSTWAPATPAQVAAVEPSTRPAAGALTIRAGGRWWAVTASPGGPPTAYTSSDGQHWAKTETLPQPFVSSGSASTTSTSTSSTTTAGAEITVPAHDDSAGYAASALCDLPPASGQGTPASTSTTTAGSSGAGSSGAGSSGAGSSSAGSSSAGPSAGAASPEGAGTLAVVGTGQFVSSGTPTATTAPAGWYRSASGRWQAAPVSPAPATGTAAAMTGCLSAGGGLFAFGTAAGSSSAPQPALWRSTDGSSWSRLTVSAFGSGNPSPLASVADAGDYWLGVANPSPTADPYQAGVLDGDGPEGAVSSDVAFGPPPSVQSGADGLWLSLDGGSTWQALDVASAPWLGTDQTELDLAAFAFPAIPVVAGSVDGQLAVWTATPAVGGTPATTAP